MKSKAIRATVLGADVSRSRSPHIHNAAFAALGVQGMYDAVSVTGPNFRKTVRALFAQGHRYVNVTIPHKRLAAALADKCSAAVEMTGAANTLVLRPNGDVFADNTDGDGILRALELLGAPVGPKNQVLLVGAGGAAAGALFAFAMRGAQITLLARRVAQASALKRRMPERLRGKIKVTTLDAPRLEQALREADTLVSAVPAAAWDDADLAAAFTAMKRNTAVVEMAYGKTTPLARLVRKHTSRYQDGIPMLVFQAAAAIKVALGKMPPTDPLFQAVAEAN